MKFRQMSTRIVRHTGLSKRKLNSDYNAGNTVSQGVTKLLSEGWLFALLMLGCRDVSMR